MTSAVLNVGSGGRPNAAWDNLDLLGVVGLIRRALTRRSTPNFIRHRLPKALPIADGSYQGIYCAQVVEHFDRNDALKILSEFARVLTAGGVARIIVPDLETQARRYLAAIESMAVERPGDGASEEYEFAKLWLIEQFVRRTPGGELTRFLQTASPQLRNGNRLSAGEPNKLVAALPAPVRHLMVVRTGQLHQWSYDRIDLVELARKAGFESVKVVDAKTSKRQDFIDFDNDELGELQVGSLYVECTR